MLDALLLSRLQFVWVIALHILLPAFTVGLASYIAVLEILHLATARAIFLRLSQFWLKIFAVSFGMGVVSGIVMPFQLGTNWSRYADATADVLGPLMTYEGLTAFFLEAGFLGVLLFGRNRVPAWLHVFAAVMVAAGTLFSTFWILSANSWMQTPAGYTIVDGRFFPADWFAVIFNPSFPYRLMHTTVAFYITTALVCAGVAAYHLRAGRFRDEGTTTLKMAFGLLTVLVPLQVVIGDQHGLNTHEHQPAKLAAIEANWETQSRMPLLLFAWPDERAEANRFEVGIPALGSVIIAHDAEGVIKGLKEWKPEDRPPVALPFFSFRLMVGIGLALLALVVCSWWIWWRGTLASSRWFLKLCMLTSPLGFVAVIAGWVTTETGRQPWVVYGLMRTRDAVTPSLAGGDVLASLAIYVVAYIAIFGAGGYFMVRFLRVGPVERAVAAERRVTATPARPLSAAMEGE
ncbi:MAG: cytochrome ubiquinol oxidase subunit I [Betaproteobacteria bacterium]|nr:MAG: cytochrome ubiquinol oxidase subunit I [Betaproteobacteria bacterium]TMH07843.1 MAG: cytochrome ubiquinol oxidase subunit I [Betaproteobacteria bacterium]